jgi:hypothetical protein
MRISKLSLHMMEMCAWRRYKELYPIGAPPNLFRRVSFTDEATLLLVEEDGALCFSIDRNDGEILHYFERQLTHTKRQGTPSP